MTTVSESADFRVERPARQAANHARPGATASAHQQKAAGGETKFPALFELRSGAGPVDNPMKEEIDQEVGQIPSELMSSNEPAIMPQFGEFLNLQPPSAPTDTPKDLGPPALQQVEAAVINPPVAGIALNPGDAEKANAAKPLSLVARPSGNNTRQPDAINSTILKAEMPPENIEIRVSATQLPIQTVGAGETDISSRLQVAQPAGPPAVLVNPVPVSTTTAPLSEHLASLTELPKAGHMPELLNLDQEEWIEKLGQSLSNRLTRDGQKIEFILHPERLGRMHVHLEIDKSFAQVHFVTATRDAAELMESHASRLAENLSQSGLQLGSHGSRQQGQGAPEKPQDEHPDVRHKNPEPGPRHQPVSGHTQIDLIA